MLGKGRLLSLLGALLLLLLVFGLRKLVENVNDNTSSSVLRFLETYSVSLNQDRNYLGIFGNLVLLLLFLLNLGFLLLLIVGGRDINLLDLQG